MSFENEILRLILRDALSKIKIGTYIGPLLSILAHICHFIHEHTCDFLCDLVPFILF